MLNIMQQRLHHTIYFLYLGERTLFMQTQTHFHMWLCFVGNWTVINSSIYLRKCWLSLVACCLFLHLLKTSADWQSSVPTDEENRWFFAIWMIASPPSTINTAFYHFKSISFNIFLIVSYIEFGSEYSFEFFTPKN